MQAPPHPREPRRLAALRRYRILDTPEEREFDEVVRLASVLCDVPIAAISFVDSDRQWFKSELGFGVRQTSIDRSICAHAILADDEIFEVPDAALDRRLREHRLIVEQPELRFYAAALLRSPEGLPIGTLCVLDTRARQLSEAQRLALRTLAHQVMVQLELRQLLRARRERERRARASARAQRFLLQLEDALRRLDDPESVLDEVTARLCRHLEATRCAYALAVADAQSFRIAGATDPDGLVRHARVSLSDVGALASTALQAGHAFVVDDVADDGRIATDGRAALVEAGIAALVWVPMHKGDRLIALLTVHHHRPHAWGRAEIRLVRDAAERCRETLERLDAERRATRERRHAELALQAGRMGVWEMDPRTGERHWNDGMFALYGIDPQGGCPDEARYRQLLVEEDRDRVAAEFERLRLQGGESEIEFRIRRADTGELRWVLSRGALLHDADGTASVIGVSVDNTARKLSERRLIEADARKDEFLAMLAHELRNPLAPLTNALHVLARSPELAQRDHGMLAMADRQVRQLRRLVDDLLEVSRITRGKIALRCEPMAVDAAVRGAVESVAAQLAQRGQRIELSLPDTLPPIVADPARIAQVLENLLNNASKYTPEGGTIRVQVRDGLHEVALQVIDDGIGIEPDKIPHLFEMFSQIDTTIDRAQGGLGIGLAMVRRLVELHGGRVSAHSAGLGLGSTFTLCLPREGPTADA